MPFLTDPLSRQLKKKYWWNKQYWKLTDTLVYRSLAGDTYRVPKGFIHDFASIPRIFWPILSPTGPYSRSAVLHDSTGDDRLFLECMVSDDVPTWLARIMWAAVGGFNRTDWNEADWNELRSLPEIQLLGD